MRVINENKQATFIFSDLADGCLYREHQDGPIFMKVSLIRDRVGVSMTILLVMKQSFLLMAFLWKIIKRRANCPSFLLPTFGRPALYHVGAKILLYHTFQILSRENVHKFSMV